MLQLAQVDEVGARYDIPQPHPLPMPEYGGYFAPLTEYLPDSGQPSSGFHRYANSPARFLDILFR